MGCCRCALLLGLGALVLFAYGCFVNLPRWDFGRLLGVHVAAFFLVAQIIAGGLVITLWRV